MGNLLFNVIFDSNGGDDPTPDVSSEASDAFTKVFEDAKLAGALGRNGHQIVANFREATADVDREFAKLTPPALSFSYGPTRKSVDLDEESIDDDSLAKMMSPHSRRKMSLKKWMAGELASGRTVNELASYAQRYDPETATLLREIGRELEA